MSPTLAPETWLYIFQHLRKPLPAPHTAIRPASTEIRQPDLVAVLQVSKTWFNLAAPLLYRIIVCDSFPLLLHGIDDPAIPGLTPKIALLAQTTRLFIEYEFAGPVDPASKALHLRPRYRAHVGRPEGGDQYEREVQGVEEVERLLASLDATKGVTGKARLLFPRLRTLALGAFGGRPDSRWEDAQLFSGWPELRIRVVKSLVGFLTVNGIAKGHYCEGHAGPLRLTSVATMRTCHTEWSSTFSYHLHQSAPGALSAIPSHTTRWYLHHDPTTLQQHLGDISDARDTIARNRDIWAKLVHKHGPRAAAQGQLDGGLYLSLGGDGGATGGFLTAEEIEAQFRTELLLPRDGADAPRWRRPEDKWEVKDINLDAPPCGACGWSVGQ